MKAIDLDELCAFVMYQIETKKLGIQIHLYHRKISNFYSCDVSAKEYISFWPTLILAYKTKEMPPRERNKFD
jgi:hypothetical protein